METYLNVLNDDQLKAVTATEGLVVSAAGPGSGKTKTLVARYAYLTDHCGVATENILCATFTNKAANEMKSRIRAIIGNKDLSFICTIHGFCKQLLKHDAEFVHYPKNFGILDEGDQKELIKEAMKRAGISSDDSTVKEIKGKIHNEMWGSPVYYEIMTATDIEKLVENMEATNDVLYHYCYLKKKYDLCDFDDLILLALYILQNSPERREYWTTKLRYVMVDEYQDCSRPQVMLIHILTSYHNNLYVVGDVDQCIYQFRGATPEYMINEAKEAGISGTRADLSLNYRSCNRLVRATQELISRNVFRIPHPMSAVRQEEGEILYAHSMTIGEEAAWVADKILECTEQGYEYEDIAILSRSRSYLRQLEETLISRNIPYKMVRGASFYEDKVVKQCISYLKMVVHERDDVFLRTVNKPARGMGKKKLDGIKEYAELNHISLYESMKRLMEIDIANNEHKLVSKEGRRYVELIDKLHKCADETPVSDMLQQVLLYLGYEKQVKEEGDTEELEMIAELKASIAAYEKSMDVMTNAEEYLADIAIYTDLADETEDRNRVACSTIHSVKGLEFPVVFVVGMNQNVFPSSQARTLSALEIERNVFYVACTRAKDLLCLTSAEGSDKLSRYMVPSRFIFEMDDYLTYAKELPQALRIKATRDIARIDRMMANKEKLSSGSRVRHMIFGPGEVLHIDDDGILVKFDRMKTACPMSIDAPLELAD